MKYVLDIPPELVDAINLHIRSGRYRSPHDFMIVAIQNQLNTESREEGWAGLGTQESPFTDSSAFETPMTSAIQLLQLCPDLAKVKTVPLSDFPRHNYLWGQYNRIFPVKIVTRVAANLARINGSEHFPLAELHEKSAQIARDLGKTIERAEKSMGRKRGTIISAGLPIGKGPGADKAKLRFKSQFVGYMAKDKIEGAAPALKFIDLCKGEKNSVLAGITDFGLKFASLPNPVIDSQDYSTPFSSEEVNFLLGHIVSEIPEEAKLIRLILSGIKEGTTTPEGLNERTKSFNPKWKKSEPVTMRAGVVSRISELGLLDRKKDGVKVTYELTKLGEEYLAKLRD